jgi:hypothetical protein
VISIKTQYATDNQSCIGMPTLATFGARTRVWTDVPVRHNASALVEGASGTQVWSPPTS